MEADYRVHVPRPRYRGADAKKLTKMRAEITVCEQVERYLQACFDMLPLGERRIINYFEVARATRNDPEVVRSIMRRIMGGSNGVTFVKRA